MARRGENIYKRKDGRYEGRYIKSYGENGKAKYGYVYDKTYSGVKEKINQARITSKLPIILYQDDQSKYDFWLNDWLDGKKMDVKESTYIRYKNIISNHISPYLGKYPICKIGSSLIEQFVRTKMESGRLDGKGGLSSKTMSDILLVIKESFNYAQKNGIHTICNFSDIKIKRQSSQMRVLSSVEEAKLTEVLLNNTDRFKLGTYICLFTGIRIGELCALQWKNVSFEDRTLKIERTMQRLQLNEASSCSKTRIIITEPKSFSSIRIIPLPDFMIEIMRPFETAPNSFILSGKSEKYIEPRTMQNKFKTYLLEGQIRDANFHSLRHTFATRCIEVGFDAKTLSEILGHSSVKITLDKYVHSSLEFKRINMEKLQPVKI